MKKKINSFSIPNVKVYKCSECKRDACNMILPTDPPCRNCGKPWYYCPCCIDCWRITAVHLLDELAFLVPVEAYNKALTDCFTMLIKQNNVHFAPEDFRSMADRVFAGPRC